MSPEIWTGSSIQVERLSMEELGLVPDPEYNHRLLISGIVHDPRGGQPPPVLELRLSHGKLRRLGAQIQALQMAGWQSGTLAGRAKNEQHVQADARRVAFGTTSATDTGQLRRIVVGLEKL